MKRTALLIVGFSLSLCAQSQDARPARGVARISVINGEVSVRRGDSGDLTAAAVNAPLVVDDRLITGPASRAEAQLDYANMVRLWSLTEVRFAELETERYTVQVARGTVTFRVLRDSRADVEVSTPNISVRPVKKGSYRITVNDDGVTEVTVRSGEADIFTPKGSERLQAGKTMIARGSAADPEFQITAAVRRDEWDEWNERRDRDLERTRSYQYVSRDIYGAEDLDLYGHWVYVDAYGWVWVPAVAPGWAPYRHGRWVWIDWWGWSWVSYDPWGWAPYHYGRWFWRTGYGWCWWPGDIHHRHYWSPALVAFFGWGTSPHVHLGIGFGHIGWVPLAPHEPYYPWWGRAYPGGSRVYVNNSMQVINNVNITNVYRNARVVNGVTGAPSEDFLHGNGSRYARVSDNEIRGVSLVKGMAPVAPVRESLRFSDREVRASALPRTGDSTQFFGRRPVPQIERASFEQQRRGMEEYVRRGLNAPAGPTRIESATQAATGAATAERPRMAASSPNEARPNEARGWRRVDDAARTSEAAAGPASAGRATGWRRFGEAPTTPATRTDATVVRSGGTARGSVESGARSGEEPRGWRRFGEPGSPRNAAERPRTESVRPASPTPGADHAPGRNDAGSGWRHFEGSQRGSGRNGDASAPQRFRESPLAAPRVESPLGERQTAPRSEMRTAPRAESAPRSAAPSRTSEPFRVGGPIVRERPSSMPAPSRSGSAGRAEGSGRSHGGRR